MQQAPPTMQQAPPTMQQAPPTMQQAPATMQQPPPAMQQQAPEIQFTMTETAKGLTREQYHESGWSDEHLIEAGFMNAPPHGTILK